MRRNVVAYLALFPAMGGTAAAARPLITGDQIAQNTITSGNIQDGAVVDAHLNAFANVGGEKLAYCSRARILAESPPRQEPALVAEGVRGLRGR